MFGIFFLLMYAHTLIGARAFGGPRLLTLGVFLCWSLHSFFFFLRLGVPWPQDPPVSVPVLELQSYTAMFSFMWVLGMNSDSHVCAASILPTESFLSHAFDILCS